MIEENDDGEENAKSEEICEFSGGLEDKEGNSGPDEFEPQPQDFASQFESDQTKGLSSKQLQRIVLLQQIKVLDLLKTKLEADSSPILLDISAFNISNLPTTDM